MNEVFLDTSYAIALTVRSDQHHDRAVELADHLQQNAIALVTTRGICLEIGNALGKVRYRAAAAALLRSLETDETLEIVSLSEALYSEAFTLYCDRQDKNWGLTDCISFIVMQQRGITAALTADEHFRQAGFRPLLREE